MAGRFNRSTIATQIVVIASAVSALVFGGMVLAINYFTADAMLGAARADLGRQLKLSIEMAEFFYGTERLEINRQMDRFSASLPELALDPKRKMRAGKVELPLLKAGRTAANSESLVDRFAAASGGAATLFVKQGQDFVMIATTLKPEDGLGTAGAAINRDSPAHAFLMKGDALVERSLVKGSQYISEYRPLKDSDGQVIGAASVREGIDESRSRLMKMLKTLNFGEKAQLVLISNEGNERGRILVHPQFSGQKIETTPLRDGFLKLAQAKEGLFEYSLTDGADGPARMVRFATIPSLGWIVGIDVAADQLQPRSVTLRNLLVPTGIIAALLNVGLLCVLLKVRLRPLGRLTKAMQGIGAGDMTTALLVMDQEGMSRNEMTILSREVAHMAKRIRELIDGIRGSSEELTKAVTSMSVTTAKVAKGTEEHSEAAASMAAAMEQMTASISHVAENASNAATSAMEARQLSEEGSRVVQGASREVGLIAEAVERSSALVRSLGERSQDISGILKVIKEIADQTNMLALNAAIEAARAGEQGRGFSVVADEVRKLAERTSDATGEIGRTVTVIQNDTRNAVAQMEEVNGLVQAGCAMAEQAAGSLTAITSGADNTVLMVRNIADAAREQGSASNQIAANVEKMAQMSGQSAVATQEAANAASDLSRLATDLREMVSRFKVA